MANRPRDNRRQGPSTFVPGQLGHGKGAYVKRLVATALCDPEPSALPEVIKITQDLATDIPAPAKALAETIADGRTAAVAQITGRHGSVASKTHAVIDPLRSCRNKAGATGTSHHDAAEW